MSANIFIARGDGYKGDTSFDPFDIIAAPLPGYGNAEREARVFGRHNGQEGTGCDYGSHVLALAVFKDASAYKGTRSLYILVQHGGGREVLAIPTFYDRGDFERALLAMPPRIQYATLYSLYNMASAARSQTATETASRYSKAIIEKRIKVRRKGGYAKVEILPEAAKS